MNKKKSLKKFYRIVFNSMLLCLMNGYIKAQTDLPKIVKPSPEVSALFKFQDYPMDYSTGLPQISIPIYEVKSGSLSVPISISYHASGRKVYDQDGPVGLGWSLNAGGVISRSIYGSADFGTPTTGTYKFPYPFKLDNITNYNDITYLQKIIHSDQADCGDNFPWLDSEYDIFSYSFGNNSGKFFFKDDNNVKTPMLLPQKPLIITPTFTSTSLNSIDITDENGIKYQFGPGERYQIGTNTATTTWILTKIVSPDNSDEITFNYTAGSENRQTINQSAELIDLWNMDQENFPVVNLNYFENTSSDGYQISRLSSIVFKQGKVVFNLVAGTYKLDNIQIYNAANEVIKTVQFNRSLCYSQSELGTTTNKLDAINLKDKLGTTVENYSFSYYPVISSDGQLNVRYRDWWGYYNNSGQHDLVPYYNNVQQVGSGGQLTNISLGNYYANREPSLEPLKSGVLKQIFYPTGGYTEFIYERNMCTLYGAIGIPRPGPGLRVYKINSADNNGIITTKTFKYGENENGYGGIELLPEVSSMAKEIEVGYMQGNGFRFSPTRAGAYRQRTFYSDFIPELNDLSNRPVTYTQVTEYLGSEISNTGKAIYRYDYKPWAASGMPVMCTGNYLYCGTSIPKKHVYDFNYWDNPMLISKTDYKRANATYSKVKETTNLYGVNTTEFVRGLHVQRVCSVPQKFIDGPVLLPGATTPIDACAEKYALYQPLGNLLGAPASLYTFSPYRISVGYKNLTQSTTTLYTDAGNITNSTIYTYNAKNLVSNQSGTNSKGETISNDTKYPFDYTGNAVLTQMVALNMLNYPVEQIEAKATLPTKSVRTNYFNAGTTQLPRIYPQTVDLKIGAGNYETRLRYSAYDNNGNPLTVSKESDHLISYVWGYNNTYPIAEVLNTAVKNVFHTSFEDATGNSTLNDSKTGHLSKTGGFTQALTNLDNGAYTLSYWQKSGSAWVLQTAAITVSTGAYTISLAGQVDEVRFYPSGAQMKTYTYDPLVGITTECDAANRISYYEYDNYGRLKLVKDLNGNILKTFKYQYKSATAN